MPIRRVRVTPCVVGSYSQERWFVPQIPANRVVHAGFPAILEIIINMTASPRITPTRSVPQPRPMTRPSDFALKLRSVAVNPLTSANAKSAAVASAIRSKNTRLATHSRALPPAASPAASRTRARAVPAREKVCLSATP